MWPFCSANNFLWLLLPLLIGLLTGWWAWGRGGGVREAFAAPGAIAGGAGAALGSAAGAVRDTGAHVFDATRELGVRGLDTVEGAAASVSGAVASAATAIGIPAAMGEPDDLTVVKGIGPKLDALLQGLGVRRFDQIAAWGPAEVAKVDAHLGAFKGRIERDEWIEQAKLLARGAHEEFEARFGSSGANDG